MKTIKILTLLVLGSILFSCGKKVLEVYNVMESQEITIPGVDSIRSVSFISSKTGLVISDVGTYKTLDGAASWSKIANYTKGTITHYTENKIAISSGYYSTDGGNSWMNFGQFDYLFITEFGELIGLSSFSTNQIAIYRAANGSTEFEFTDLIPVVNYNISKIKYHNGYVTFFSGNWSDKDISTYNINTETYIKLENNETAAEEPTDVCFTGNRFIFSAKDGALCDAVLNGSEISYISRFYYEHTYPFIAIDMKYNYVVAVGEKTVSTNKANEYKESGFSEVLTPELRSLGTKYVGVSIIDSNHIALVGANGKLYKSEI